MDTKDIITTGSIKVSELAAFNGIAHSGTALEGGEIVGDSIKMGTIFSQRPCSPGLDAYWDQPLNVLDHGFVRLVDYMGNDAAIVQAARTSYGQGTTTLRGDRGLLRYLMRHWHTGPFEMCELKLHLKMPMAIAEQLIRHRTANINKLSGRYSILPSEFYIPAPEFIGVQAVDNKQGRGETLDADVAQTIIAVLNAHATRCYDLYEELADKPEDGGFGMARELARFSLPANIYTELYWKMDLHNLFHFLSLRLDQHAQYEIRVFAEKIAEMVKAWVPLAYEAFEDYRLGAVHLSRMEIEVIRQLLSVETRETAVQLLQGFDVSSGEVKEFMAKLVA